MGRIPNIPWLSCCWSRSFYSSSRSCGIFHDASQNLSRTRVLTTQIFFKSNIFCLQKYEAWLSLADILYHPTVALIATMMTTVQQMQSCVYFDIIFIFRTSCLAQEIELFHFYHLLSFIFRVSHVWCNNRGGEAYKWPDSSKNQNKMLWKNIGRVNLYRHFAPQERFTCLQSNKTIWRINFIDHWFQQQADINY